MQGQVVGYIGRCEHCGKFVGMRNCRDRFCSNPICRWYGVLENRAKCDARARTERKTAAIEVDMIPCKMQVTAECSGLMPAHHRYGCDKCREFVERENRIDDDWAYFGPTLNLEICV